MTMVETVGSEQTTPGSGRRRPGSRAALAAVAAALVSIGVVFVSVERGRPAAPAFHDGLAFAGTTKPVSVGATYLALMDTSPLPDVTVLAGEPRVVEGSAEAVVTVIICDPATSLPGDGPQDLAKACASARSADGVDLGSLPPGNFLMTMIVPLESGPITVDGADITYTDGAGKQTQTVGVHIELP